MSNTVRLQRANFVVADMEKSLTFYRDVLGFTVEFEQGHNPDSYSIPVFEIPDSVELKFCTLNSPTQRRVMALSEFGKIEMPKMPFPRRAAIVLECSDPDFVMKGARKLGLHVYREERLETHDGRIGREIGIVDFDDNLVVIYSIEQAAS